MSLETIRICVDMIILYYPALFIFTVGQKFHSDVIHTNDHLETRNLTIFLERQEQEYCYETLAVVGERKELLSVRLTQKM